MIIGVFFIKVTLRMNLGLLIVLKTIVLRFLLFFPKPNVLFLEKNYRFENGPLILNFQKSKLIVFENDIVLQTFVFFKNEKLSFLKKNFLNNCILKKRAFKKNVINENQFYDIYLNFFQKGL